MQVRKLVCKELHMVVGKLVRMVLDTLPCKALDMVVGMVHHKLVCKQAHMVVGMLACKVVVGMVEDMVLHMAPHMVVGKQVCKALGKQACMVVDKLVCMAYKREGMVHNNRQHNGWNSLSTRAPIHPIKATRPKFLVVFSSIDSLC